MFIILEIEREGGSEGGRKGGWGGGTERDRERERDTNMTEKHGLPYVPRPGTEPAT